MDKLRKLRCPLFAFGQTVCWDEPMKAVLMDALQRSRMHIPFVVGIHDTDYFSKVHRYLPTMERFVIIPRNDGSLADAWVATCEASILFGSETPPTVREYLDCQIPFRQLAREASEGKRAFTDRWTEAWGWRAIIYNAPRAPVAAQMRARDILPHLRMLMEWALYETLNMLTEPTEAHQRAAEEILSSIHEAHEVAMASNDDSISGLYQR
ncbi:MAG TPA: hypothetical protein EYP10_07460, partial [Armatimonadetes bacterium]|nr:hypothetical protein [Armatimonadota bacterium]